MFNITLLLLYFDLRGFDLRVLAGCVFVRCVQPFLVHLLQTCALVGFAIFMSCSCDLYCKQMHVICCMMLKKLQAQQVVCSVMQTRSVCFRMPNELI